jgi:hypothetical protein
MALLYERAGRLTARNGGSWPWWAVDWVAGAPAALRRCLQSEKDAVSAQNLGQRQPLVAVFSRECMGQLVLFGPT